MVAAGRCKETVPTAWQGFDETRIVGRIAQSFAQLVDRGIQTIVEINEGILRPDLLTQFFTRDHFAGMPQ